MCALLYLLKKYTHFFVENREQEASCAYRWGPVTDSYRESTALSFKAFVLYFLKMVF